MKKTAGRPLWLGALTLLLAGLFIGCRSAPTRTAADLRNLQGYWEGAGPGGECAVTISGNSLLYTQPKEDEASEEFWFETNFTLPAGTDPKQLHATIVKYSSPQQEHVGKVVVTIFRFEDGKLTLGVVKDFEGPPPEPIQGDWDWAFDQYHLERAQPPIEQALPP